MDPDGIRGYEDAKNAKKQKGKNEGKSRNDDNMKKESKDSSDFGFKQQNLFLVEFLVDTVTIDSCSVDDEVLEGQTCLSLTFLNFPPMEICEKDFDPNKEHGVNKVRFNCGKSLMFAFNENQCEKPPPLLVEITVSKKLGDDENPVKVDIGTIKICISELFRQIVEIAKYKPQRLPASKSIKDCFMLVGPGKRTMGEVSVYIRLSCLGQNVVTEFQCGPDLKSSPVLFKNREGKKVYEFSGNELADAKETSGVKAKAGCGCIHPQAAQSQTNRGGQGDAGRSAGGACPKGNRVVLDMPNKPNRFQEERKSNNFGAANKLADNKPNQEGNVDKNVEKTIGNNDLTVSETSINQDQNCFVLKVGDKGQIPDRGKMILEFRTPKQKILPKILPPYHEDIAVQTDSQKKGKKGKGKGKGKGKKKK